MGKILRRVPHNGAKRVPALSPEQFREEVARELGIDWDAERHWDEPTPTAKTPTPPDA